MKRFVAILVVLAAAGIFGWQALRPAPLPVLITHGVAQPMDDGLAVFLTLENTGPPLSLTAVASAEAARATIMGARSPLAIPGAGRGIFAADGAHLMLQGPAGEVLDGRLIPLELKFGPSGAVTTRVRVTLAGGMVHGQGGVTHDPAPQVAVAVVPKGAGWAVSLTTEHLDFVTADMGTAHVPGEGHAHLYLNGLKLARLYGPEAEIGALPPGRHTVEVSLNTNDHQPYLANGAPIIARAVIVVE